MKYLLLVLGLALAPLPTAMAHQQPHPTYRDSERMSQQGVAVQKGIVVHGTVSDLKKVLYPLLRTKASSDLSDFSKFTSLQKHQEQP